MNMTLAQLKQTARNRMDQGYPGGIGTVLRGALLYLLLNLWVDGDPFAFASHQEHWHQGYLLVWYKKS